MSATLYHPVMYDRTEPVGSFWEASAAEPVPNCEPLQGDVRCDVAIIGAGYTGLSAAYHLSQDDDVEVRVLEAGVPGWGASGRNGGHCCFGGAGLSATEISAQFGEEVARENIKTQRESIDLVDELSSTHNLDIDKHGVGEIEVAHIPKAVKWLHEEAEVWRQLGGFECEIWSAEEFAERGYRAPRSYGASVFPFGFALHPMRYARELARLAQRAGATIHAHSTVTHWSRENGMHRLHTATGTVTAAKVLVATNGFTLDELHPAFDGCLLPGLSQVVATRALTDDELAAHNWNPECGPLYDTRSMFSYFQMSLGRHLVLGGGGGVTGTPASRESWKRFLSKRVTTLFPQWRDVEIIHSWRGFWCMTRDALTHIGEVEADPGVFYSLAYHGNGVAMATWSGRAAAGLITGRSNTVLPVSMRQPLRKFPIPILRKWSIYSYFAMRILKGKAKELLPDW